MKYLIANQIRIFLAIIEKGSITAAADQLSMGKSAVSDALKQLEASLNVQLIIRTTRRQRLTPMGEQFYHRCRELNNLSIIALEEISEHLAEPSGMLRLTAPHAIVEYCVAPALADLIQHYPRVEPELIIDDQRLELVGQNIDLALSVGELPDSDFKAQRVGVLNDVLCVAPDFFDKQNIDPAAIQTLQDLPYIANHWEEANIVHQLSSRDSEKATTFRFRRVATVSSVNAVFALIRQGVGIGNLPHIFIQDKIKSGQLIELLPNFKPRSANIYAVHPYNNTPPLGIKALVTLIKQYLNGF